MLVRSLAFILVLSALALGTFRVLVDGEVKRVVSVHVLDKSTHLVEMINYSLRGGRTFDEALERADFLDMARAMHVVAVSVFDAEGNKIRRIGATRSGAVDPVTGQSESAPHSADMGADRGDHGSAVHSGSHSHAGHDHAQGALDRLLEERLETIRAPAAAVLRPLAMDEVDHYVQVDALENDLGASLNYAQVVLPIRDAENQRIGHVGFLLNVSHIHTVYSHGVRMFGTLFMICGLVLFGVPAFAFWLQKRFAEKSSRAAKYLSRHDALTGLLNRSAFVAEGGQLVRAGQIGHAAYLDLDRFKLVNDTYGHKIGDALLCHVAALLKENCGPHAVIARLGGDEFSFALTRDIDQDPQEVVDRLMAAAARDVAFDGIALSASMSIGVAEAMPGDTLDALLQRADTALYFAKSRGRNLAAVYNEEMGAAAARRCYLETRLREASVREEFDLAYQPLVEGTTGRTVGYEALLRLADSEGRPVPPSEFVPIAEEIGLIESIGTWVLRTATRQIAAFDDETTVSVNLSADQFRSGRLVEFVSSALAESGLAPHRLELEITESILLEHETHTEFQIDALKDMGVSIAMDDFGTGFSSLSTLWKYGFDRIKIDRSFVQALEVTPEKSRQLIEAIVLMGRRMGMGITAEGVENEAHRRLLVDLGCELLQGFHFGKPEPLAQPAAQPASRSA